ncbi:hypothetical protein CA54_33690 [Symmachiella macrocystis]|uniref:Uncharacterized protein n=1 Tax=Symmachiella macrocystis TaxID=2527985 RepID=A0A5C6BS14_9PLAN|nr:hypothetical protein CA54_33690 [Symmachiella macrocystis]
MIPTLCINPYLVVKQPIRKLIFQLRGVFDEFITIDLCFWRLAMLGMLSAPQIKDFIFRRYQQQLIGEIL